MKKEKKHIILWIPHLIYSDSELSGNAKLILSEILSLLMVDDKFCWASNNHFAEMFNLKRTNVVYHIQQLEKSGWIKTRKFKDKKSGWGRKIYPAGHLVNILTTLVNKTDTPSQNTVYPSQSASVISNTLSSTINNTKSDLRKYLDHTIKWAYERAQTRPAITRTQFEISVLNAIDRVGLEKVRKVSEMETNAISFLTQIKSL